MPSTVVPKKKSKYDYTNEQSLCWDCFWSTHPEKCQWVARNKPVKGWNAEPTRVSPRSAPFDSYKVVGCPKFKRDSYRGGLVDPPNRRRVKLWDDDIPNLASAIIEQAVTDWIALDYGAIDSILFCGQSIERKKLLEFFFSRWFEVLLESFSEWTPKQIRRAIKIKGDSIENWRGW